MLSPEHSGRLCIASPSSEPPWLGSILQNSSLQGHRSGSEQLLALLVPSGIFPFQRSPMTLEKPFSCQQECWKVWQGCQLSAEEHPRLVDGGCHLWFVNIRLIFTGLESDMSRSALDTWVADIATGTPGISVWVSTLAPGHLNLKLGSWTSDTGTWTSLTGAYHAGLHDWRLESRTLASGPSISILTADTADDTANQWHGWLDAECLVPNTGARHLNINFWNFWIKDWGLSTTCCNLNIRLSDHWFTQEPLNIEYFRLTIGNFHLSTRCCDFCTCLSTTA